MTMTTAGRLLLWRRRCYRVESAKLFATLLLTLEGTPFLLQGEEIGMTNVYYDTIEEYNDVETSTLSRTSRQRR